MEGRKFNSGRDKNAVAGEERLIASSFRPEDIDVEGLGDVTTDTVKDLLTVDKALWKEEVKGSKEFYAKFGDKLPKELESQLSTLEANLDK